MQSPATADAALRKRGRRTLLLLLAVCAAPLVASYALYFRGGTEGHVNYGDLIAPPRPLDAATLSAPDGRALPLSALKGQWVLVTVDDAACDARCREKLVYMRQVRLAQGRETGRIERLWVISGGTRPDAALLAEHDGLLVARDPAGHLVPALPAPRAPSDHIYVIDPLGNLMMRFPADPDPRRMLKDVARLLRHSKWK